MYIILHKSDDYSGGSTGGGGRGLGGLNPLGLPSKNLMCIEKTPSLCPDPHSMFL